MQRHLAAIFVFSMLAARGPSQDVGPPRSGEIAAIATPLAEAIPDLASHSSWAQHVRFEGNQPDTAKRGAYVVGNGRVFGYLGLGARANTMQGVSGPSYQTARSDTPDGHFGEHSLELAIGGKAVDLPEQHVRKVRGANFVVSVDELPGRVSLRTLTFAPPSGTEILRVIELANLSRDQALDAVTLRLSGGRDSYDEGGWRCRARYTIDGKATREVQTTLAAGASQRFVLAIHTSVDAAPAPSAPRDSAAGEATHALAAARASLAWWQQKLKPTAYFDTDHRKLRDIVNDWKVTMLVMRDATHGAVGPLLHHRRTGVRDSVGPLLAFLRFNMWAEAKALLVYLHQATRLLDRVPVEIPLDLDFSALANKQVDWDKVDVGASDVPSLLLLMHFWYWRVTRDHDLIRGHMPLLKRCLVGQSLSRDVLLPFHGSEPYLHGALTQIYPGRAADDVRLVADAAESGRRAYSFAAAVEYLIAIQAMSDIENGLDEVDHPERYTGGDPPKDRPGQRWLTRSFKFMQDLEKVFWLPEQNLFAPAVSPVTLEPHRQPLADANLTPLWVGWTFPTGERSRDNLATALKKLWVRDGRVGATPTLGYACGDTQGKLVVALGERDAKQRFQAVDALLAMAEPAGEWSQLYGPDGRPCAAVAGQPALRCRPGESGINVDALLFAVSGIRFVTVPNWDARDIRGELRLPPGATYVTMRSIRKDNRDIDLYWRETTESMTEDERKANEEKAADKRRDPNVPHRRMRFRMELNSPNPKAGYYDVGMNAACTLFVRYLQQGKPLDEVEFWAEDNNEFLPASGPAFEPATQPIKLTPQQKILALSNRNLAQELLGSDPTVKLVDTGLPMTLDDLTAALLDGKGGRNVDTLYLDWNADATGRATYKGANFWSGAALNDALAKFTAAGGRVLRTQFLRAFAGGNIELGADGRVEVTLQEGQELTLTATVTAATAQEAVLRIGSSCSVTAVVNGQATIEHQGSRALLPDQDSALVKLNAGANAVQLRLRGSGKVGVFARVTDSRGLPVDGLQ